MLRFNFSEVGESKIEKYLNVDLLLLFLVVAFAIVSGMNAESSVRVELDSVRNEKSALESERKRMKKLEEQKKVLDKKRQELSKMLKVVKELDAKRGVPKVLYFFADPSKVKGVWFETISITGDSLKIEGNCITLETLHNFLSRVDKELGEITFKEAQLKSYESKSLGLTFQYYSFIIEVRLKKGGVSL